MIKVGLTGNIGSGKTTVCRIFEALEIPVFYADLEAKKLYEHADVKEKIMKKLGESVFSKNKIDFGKLATKIFSNPKELIFINELIHPLVFKQYSNWLMQHLKKPYTIHESAILFEHNLQHQFDKIITVYAPEPLRIKRVMERDHRTKENVLKMINNQLSDRQKNKQADFVIINDGEQFLIPQVIKIDTVLNN